ncbi:hypothetical protein A2714_05535 [Candidatus Woesebacteria bacterium RIFCSPHIGHO2_01_FULL_38_9]|uniref:Glycosyltransferase RgtA/B/C/D-like domain-containing protein n=1 Tax=Candidatus Woesebacteria bacterium RIFCSPHIGHO2_01_FULL_38_9 TaxID=1802492 RepID=A0A1F7Y336_9BACT|nr:MAG: hypothetical protein A2714_05535 [Candidatus Woesebacteria bacterium RIFCSPHIGHO2_01_FULL_38_9]
MAFLIGKLWKKEIFYILLIFGVALFARFYKLSQHPVSLSMDEVSIGYNAYSILKTGRDEWGQSFPLAFRSVGDYKPPVNIYLTVPSIAFIGLTEFAVRAPVALLGSLSVIVFIFLLKELEVKRIGYLFGGFWLAIVAWHIHFSRGSFEAVTALFFILLGVLWFLICIRKKSLIYFSFSLALFALSLWAYHAERLFTPFFLLFLLFIYRKDLGFLVKKKEKLFISLIPFIVLIIPFIHLTFFTKVVQERAISTSILREQSLIRELNYGKYQSTGEAVFDNDLYLIFRHFLGKYLNYFDLRFWFWKGMQYTPPGFLDVGLFYAVDILVILVGIYSLIIHKNKNLRSLAIFWFFVGPIPAAFTMNEQHPLRALIWIPFFGISAAAGFEATYNFLKRNKKYLFVYVLLLLINIIYFADIYLRQFPRFFSESWQYGYKEISLYVCQNQDRYDNIYITDTFGSIVPNNTGLPGLYILFYCKIDPTAHFTFNSGFEKIKIKRMVWDKDNFPENSLVIGSYWDLPPDKVEKSMIVKKVDYPSGKPAFIFVDTTRRS